MEDKVELGTVSSRGQICIPNSIREEMGLSDGNKVLFMLSDGNLIVKKVNTQTFAEITKPLKEEMKKSSLREEDVVGLIHRMRKKEREKNEGRA